MTADERLHPVLVRQDIIASIMAVNERQLKCESTIYGREIERACVLKDIDTSGATPVLEQQLQALDAEIARLTAEGQKLGLEREWLEQTLAEAPGDAAHARKQ
jgi:hypothetical protein